jgi:hypothetical protein
MKFVALFFIVFLTSCASVTNIDRVERQVDALQFRVSKLETQISDTNRIAKEALVQAEFARLAADKAAQTAEDTNKKVDKLFELFQKK